MITQLDSQPWSKELFTGNSQFLEIGSVIYVVSQVRADNTFAVFKSLPAPPKPGPGYVFEITATYAFPVTNTSFDPVITYDGSRYIYIVGTQDNADGDTDVVLFTYDIQNETVSPPVNPLSDPITLITASYIRDSYDICTLGDNQFVAVSVTNPLQIWETPTTSQPVSINISGGIITVYASNSYKIGQVVTFSGLQNANFLNNVSVSVSTSTPNSFTAINPVAAEFYTIPSSYPYTLSVNNAENFITDSRVIYTSSSVPLTNVTETNAFTLSSVSVAEDGTTTYTGTFPNSLPSGTATISGFTNTSNNGVFNVVSYTNDTLIVDNPNGISESNVGLVTILSPAEYTAIEGVYTFHQKDAGAKVSIFYSFTLDDYIQVGYESGFVTWLPGHSLLGFELDMNNADPFVSMVVIDSSPFRTGLAFGATSVYSSDGVSIEVYYESHPKQMTNTDQTFNLNLATFTSSPPQWNLPATILKTFTGRYADNRLMVVPQGGNRTLLQQYYSQLVHQNALVGNLFLGYYTSSPPIWNFHVESGSNAISYIQGSISVSNTQGTFVSYISEPVYPIKGAWSPEIRSYGVNDKVSFNKIDYVATAPITYAYQGMWTANSTYTADAIVKVMLPTLPITYGYYVANTTIPVSGVSPNLDTTNWSTVLSPDVDSRFSVAPTAWPLNISSFDTSTFNLSNISGFYNNLNFTWLRGTKSIMDDESKWALVGEQVGAISGATYVSDFNVPPIVKLEPNGSTVAYRGSTLALDASGATDGDQNTVQYTWMYSPSNSSVSLTSSGATAGLTINRSIGGNAEEFIVGVVAVDYEGTTPLHPPMNITNVGFIDGVATISTDATVNIADGEQVFLYNISTADFLNNHQATVTAVNGNSFSATVDDIQKTELWTIPESSPYSITVYNSANFSSDLGVVYSSGGQSPSYTQNNGTYTFGSEDAGKTIRVSYTYSFTHADYPAALDTGYAIANAQFASLDVSVPFNSAPTITFPENPISALRNTSVTITPVYSGVSDLDDATTYTWSQISGTSIPSSQIISGTNSSFLEFETNGVKISGESLVWSLTVNDGVNAPVAQSVTVDVEAYPFEYPDTSRLSRSIWSGTISQRNTVQSWSALDVSAMYTNFQSIKRTSVLDGTDRYLLISPGSVSVYGGINPNTVLLRKLFPPIDNTLDSPTSYPIIDAVHTEDDWTLVLDGSGSIHRFSTAPLINTDDPDTTLKLSSITSMSFNKIFTTYSFSNIRILVLTGKDGCLLLQLRDTDLSVEGSMEISVETRLLYGNDNVQFVRTSNVESLNKGKILLGTIAQVVASITSIGISGNIVTVTAKNSFSSGAVIKFGGLTGATFLNGVTASVVSATADNFVISYQHDDYPITEEGDTAQASTGGKTYETLIDLSHGQIIGTWDASKLRNQYVSTGEILFEPNDTYSGRPSAPVLNPISIGTSIVDQQGYVNVNINWTADRPDLIQSYSLEVSMDSEFNNFVTTLVNSGYIEAVNLPQPIGQSLYVRVKAYSVDGGSPYSNIQTIST